MERFAYNRVISVGFSANFGADSLPTIHKLAEYTLAFDARKILGVVQHQIQIPSRDVFVSEQEGPVVPFFGALLKRQLDAPIPFESVFIHATHKPEESLNSGPDQNRAGANGANTAICQAA